MLLNMWNSIWLATLLFMLLTTRTSTEKINMFDLMSKNSTRVSNEDPFEKEEEDIDLPAVSNGGNLNLDFSGIEDIDSFLKNDLGIEWHNISQSGFDDVRKANNRINEKTKKKGNALKALISRPLPLKYRLEALELHNEARKNVKPSASNMRKLTWDTELEKLALEQTSTCTVECNVKPTHPRYGRIRSTLVTSTKIMTADSAIIRCAVQLFKQNGKLYKKTKNKPMCAPYLNMADANAFKIGCAVTLCGRMNIGKSVKKGVIMLCLYGPGYQSEKPYIPGPRCSKCDKAERCVGGLCSHRMREKLNAATVAKWSDWTQWSKCSKKCGKAIRERTRVCSSYLFVDCEGDDREVKKCITKPCRSKTIKHSLLKNSRSKSR